MKVYIDDIRDPVKHLTAEQSEGIIWLKEWWEAKNFLYANEAEIEVIHFDHFMGDPRHTGGDLFLMVAYRFERGKMFGKLKKIYLHSSDRSIVDKFMDKKEMLAEQGVELIKNCNRY